MGVAAWCGCFAAWWGWSTSWVAPCRAATCIKLSGGPPRLPGSRRFQSTPTSSNPLMRGSPPGMRLNVAMCPGGMATKSPWVRWLGALWSQQLTGVLVSLVEPVEPSSLDVDPHWSPLTVVHLRLASCFSFSLVRAGCLPPPPPSAPPAGWWGLSLPPLPFFGFLLVGWPGCPTVNLGMSPCLPTGMGSICDINGPGRAATAAGCAKGPGIGGA
mmetsp:Transcript_12454/g.29704  ORF Transcript_12454/g.29704 Transcript_12454/m.29704 type:complete len:214 (-) Transcript_12454:185-826(-)